MDASRRLQPGFVFRLLKSGLTPLVRRLPLALRRELRAWRVHDLVRSGRFACEQPEYGRLSTWLQPGDAAMDGGANFGPCSLRLATFVGKTARVYCFEPVPQTFVMLVR